MTFYICFDSILIFVYWNSQESDRELSGGLVRIGNSNYFVAQFTKFAYLNKGILFQRVSQAEKSWFLSLLKTTTGRRLGDWQGKRHWFVNSRSTAILHKSVTDDQAFPLISLCVFYCINRSLPHHWQPPFQNYKQ